ncbi:MAG TPA: S41 family peptidase [Candidatus Saccharimonadia bacterium]|nr:S41 family peptidase [Candidatus Saccharimonadia bacterium]
MIRRSMLFLALCAGGWAVSALADDAAVPAAPAEATAAETGKPAQPSISLEDIQTFVAVFRAVKDAYVEPVDDKVLMQAAIKGLLGGLDPHSEYLDTRGVETLDEETTGAYAGLGVEVLMLEGALRVIAPIDDTPASRAGLKPGDVILQIDGKPVTSDNGNEAVEQLRGSEGSQVALTIAREGQATPIEVKLRREVIRVASVRTRMLEPGYGYVRITQFQNETGGEVREKLRRMMAQSKGSLRGVVLDLRSNPGGLLHASVEVSDAFLDGGVIVSTRGRVKEADVSFSAAKGDLIEGAPLVVLVDGGTASAAEIVAGALKDHHRGLVMGATTFGKGSVQTVLPLDSGYAVKLTTARYFTPSGTSIQASDIRPDIALADLRLTPPDAPASPITTEADLPRHLQSSAVAGGVAGFARDPELDTDYALNEALNVLKGLALSRERARPTPKG